MPKKPSASKTIETLTHFDEKRKNIPTAEHQAVLDEEQKKPRQIRYPRNTDLDPQLVWRGKDEQDWSDLVVPAPPLYIQEKIHPKALVDDLLRQSKAAAPVAQFDLFHDFNGIPHGAEKTDFYQHDQNWTNRMLLGDSLQDHRSIAVGRFPPLEKSAHTRGCDQNLPPKASDHSPEPIPSPTMSSPPDAPHAGSAVYVARIQAMIQENQKRCASFRI